MPSKTVYMCKDCPGNVGLGKQLETHGIEVIYRECIGSCELGSRLWFIGTDGISCHYSDKGGQSRTRIIYPLGEDPVQTILKNLPDESKN